MRNVFVFDSCLKKFSAVFCFATLILILQELSALAQSNCVAPPTGLAAWWQAEGTARDVVSGTDGVLINGTSFSAGYVGQAFSFNGVNQYITNSLPGLTNILNSYTMEFWARPTMGRASTAESTGNIDGTSNQRYAIYPNNGKFGAVGSGVSVGTNGVSVFESGSAYLPALLVYDAPITNWTHIAVVYSNQQPSLYLNGTLAHVGLTSTRASYPSACLGEQGVGFGYYAGFLDEVSIYNRALTAAEIGSIYNAGNAGKCPPPSPPYIILQPTNETVTVGSTALFSVTAGGSLPLSYQWSFNGAAIANATNSNLILANVQFSDAGGYSVLVTNAIGSTNSVTATLTVNPAPPPCLSPPSGIISWWPGEGNANDVVGTNNGVELGGVIYTNGMVGQGFYFNGAGSYVRISSSPTLGPSNEFTLEFWYKAERNGVGEGLVARRNSESGPLNYEVGITSGSYIDVFYNDPNVSGDTDHTSVFEISRYSPAPPAGGFHHIAAAYRQADVNTVEVKTYLDGQLVRIRDFGAVLNRAINDAPVTFGLSVEYPTHEYFQGVIDEVSLYNRVLSDTEVQAIYNSGSTGKCLSATGPYISVQPTNETAYVGQSVVISVGAAGSPPLGYQWIFNDTNIITGATSGSLTLNNLQFANAGKYSVVVTNPYGSVVSTNALLTILSAPPCVPPPPILLSWWRAEDNAVDESGANNGTLSGNAVFLPAEVGRGFVFDGSGDAVQIGNAVSLRLQDFTIEAWIKRSSSSIASFSSGGGEIFGYGSGGYCLGIADGGNLFLTRVDIDNVTTSAAITDTSFHHVAVTKSGATAVFYIDGVSYPAPPYSATFTFSSPAAIGARGDSLANSFYGTIDEVAVYGRALSAAEIQSIFAASVSGKCPTNFPPFIITQPANQTVTVGANVSIGVTAGGSTPLSYQWRFNGNNIAGATANPLALNSVQINQAGNYSVVVTNVAGSATSSNALLTINFPPAAVRLGNTNCLGGSFVSVPVLLVANGNENAFAFSLSFDTRLLYYSTTLGNGAPGADLMVNTTQTNGVQAGRVGVEVIMPSGATFSPGTQVVAMVTFFATNVPATTSAGLSFADQPTPRQLLDNQLNILNANYFNGLLTIFVSALEGDVFPHTNGDRSITLADWLQIGRYVARLDFPTNSSEFQRADCAPRATLGDGSIRATDWIQAGRYNAGLDLLTALGGPTNEIAPPPLAPSGTRILSVASASLTPGTPTTVPITLAAQGNESALSFSVLFDTSRVTLVGAAPGSGASGATVFVNTNQAASGLVGFAAALGAGNTFPAGNLELARLTVQALPTASGSFTPIFTDQPAWRDVSDLTALSLPVGYSPGIITINGALNLRIAQAGTNVLLAWPLWANSFTLQEATNVRPGNSWSNLPVTPGVSNNENVVSLPITGTMKLYRLYHP